MTKEEEIQGQKDYLIVLKVAKQQIHELKDEVKEMQKQILEMASRKACPTLTATWEEIKSLKSKVRELEDYQRNNLLKE